LETLIDGEDGGQIEKQDNQWFSMTVIAENGNIVCLSHSGQIACVQVRVFI